MIFEPTFVEYLAMNRSIVYTIIISAVFMGALSLGSQEAEKKQGTCFQVANQNPIEVCIDFQNSWYYSVKHPTGWLINVRPVNTKAVRYIWNDGQFFISNEEMEKIKTSLASQGLAIVCPPPDYRYEEDKLKSREEICKK